MDLGPTVISIAGAKVPEWMDGQAFLGPQKAKPRDHFMAIRDRMDSEYDLTRAIRDTRWKYIRHFQPQRPMLQSVAFRKQQAMVREMYALHAAGKLNSVQAAIFAPTKSTEELYDTVADPFEIHSLAKDPGKRAELVRLRGLLAEDLAAALDWGFIPEPEMVARFWPGFKQPGTALPVFERYQGMLQLRSSTEGASIAYQAGAAIGGAHWELYHRPLRLEKGTRVRAVAVRIGYASSDPVDGIVP
jgi:N-sulfoglucosamine sulfohydrolase